MNSRPILSIIPLALLASCTTQGGPGFTLACGNVAGHVYQGDMHDSAGNVLATVTLSMNDPHPPGFKHNVLVTMTGMPPGLPQYDGECADGPMVFNIYQPVSQPPPSTTKLAVWTVAPVVPEGYAFHLTDSGSSFFRGGAQGDFQQIQ